MLTRTSAVVVLALLGGSSPALADPWGNIDCDQAPVPLCDLEVGNVHESQAKPTSDQRPGVPAHSGDAENPYADCRYKSVDYRPPGGAPGEPGGWFMVLCSPDGKDSLSHGPVWIPAGTTGQPAPSPEQVAEIARNRLLLPEVQIAASPFDVQLVNLPTWLWVRSGWQEVEASASVSDVSITAVAAPVSVTWSMGDGSTVTCAGAGTAYEADSDPASSSPDCGHTYRRSSASHSSHAYPVTATVHWNVTWSGAGRSGTFPEMTTTGTASFRVAESQALNNDGG